MSPTSKDYEDDGVHESPESSSEEERSHFRHVSTVNRGNPEIAYVGSFLKFRLILIGSTSTV